MYVPERMTEREEVEEKEMRPHWKARETYTKDDFS